MSNQSARAASVPDVLEEIPRRAIAGWILLVYAGGISAWFNIWHSVLAGRMELALAVGAGLTPVVCSMVLSHIAAQEHDEQILRWVAYIALIIDMAMSLRAVGEVVRPAEGSLWWLFGPGTDMAEFVGLYVIMKRARARAAYRKRLRAVQAADRAAAEAARELAAGPDQLQPDDAGLPPAARAGAATSERGETPRQTRRAPAGIDRSAEAKRARQIWLRSKAEGRPLTDRKLAAQFGRSRTWGANRIAEAQAAPHLVATGTDDGQR